MNNQPAPRKNSGGTVFDSSSGLLIVADGVEDTTVRPRRPNIPREWPPARRPVRVRPLSKHHLHRRISPLPAKGNQDDPSRSDTGHKRKESQFPDPIQKVLFAPDGKHLAIGNGNGAVSILRLPAELMYAAK